MNGLSPRKIRTIFSNPAAATIPPFPGGLLPITFTLICFRSMLDLLSLYAWEGI
jgi:hypothetical protein